ncbi:MAG: TonB-dependent receptor [Deferribacteraceae bacterium]|jgi:iron complex outermembrane receptor protein|nr:TonB-dependent receptor [Deferribacteraceae bacterium]
MKRLLFFCWLVLIPLSLSAQSVETVDKTGTVSARDEADDDVITLEDIEVTAERERGEYISRERMEEEGAENLWEAVRYTPGVILSGGGRRNDSNFTVRGFGADSVPVYIDGILLANPYRGESDTARLLIGDLESITIHKGYSSTLLGANTLGGAVVMRTAKPKKAFEATYKGTLGLDSEGNYASNSQLFGVGGKHNLFYGRAVYQYRDIDHFRLPREFEPTALNPQEKGERLWSGSIDRKLTLIAGITPIDELDISFTYIDQDADKGLSPPETVLRDYQIWEWTVWKRNTYSFNASYEGDELTFDLLAYYDKYDDAMLEYYNMASYLYGVHYPSSDYDEYSAGGRLLGSWEISKNHKVQGSFTFKREDHKGLRKDVTEIHVNEDTVSAGAEYTAKLFKPLTLVGGFGYDTLIPNEYWSKADTFAKLIGSAYYTVKTGTMRLYSWQLGVFYEPVKNHEVHLTYARKNHFPSMSERYSTRFGTVLPNPNLGPEIANHIELGYKGFINKLNLSAAIYYSIVTGKIVNIELPNPDNPNAAVDYARNLDETAFYVAELSAEYHYSDMIGGGLAGAVNRYSINRTHAEDDLDRVVKYITDYPEYTANAYILFEPAEFIKIIPRAEYISARHANTAGTNELPEYLLAHIKAEVKIGEHFTVSASVENIFDKLYEIREYYPMPGRTYSIGAGAKY